MGQNKMQPLVDHIETYLKREGKSISQFCRDADIAVPTLSRFLKGERGIAAANIRKLATAAGESSDHWLLLAGIREDGGITITPGLTRADVDEFPPYKMSPEELELSDKIARLSATNRAIVESVVDILLAQNISAQKKR